MLVSLVLPCSALGASPLLAIPLCPDIRLRPSPLERAVGFCANIGLIR